MSEVWILRLHQKLGTFCPKQAIRGKQDFNPLAGKISAVTEAFEMSVVDFWYFPFSTK